MHLNTYLCKSFSVFSTEILFDKYRIGNINFLSLLDIKFDCNYRNASPYLN